MPNLLSWVKKYWLLLSLFILSAITVLSLWPLPELPSVPGNDKTHHIMAYAVLIWPIALKKSRHWWWLSLGLVFWGGGIELIQPYVNRYGELRDFAANLTGLGCGILLAGLTRWLESAISQKQ